MVSIDYVWGERGGGREGEGACPRAGGLRGKGCWSYGRVT